MFVVETCVGQSSSVPIFLVIGNIFRWRSGTVQIFVVSSSTTSVQSVVCSIVPLVRTGILLSRILSAGHNGLAIVGGAGSDGTRWVTSVARVRGLLAQ